MSLLTSNGSNILTAFKFIWQVIKIKNSYAPKDTTKEGKIACNPSSSDAEEEESKFKARLGHKEMPISEKKEKTQKEKTI